MLASLNLKTVMFIDIETVPQWDSYGSMPDELRLLWDRKASFIAKDRQTSEDVFQRAGIYAEFGKIICISVGLFDNRKGAKPFRVKSYYGHDEQELLMQFSEALKKASAKKITALCAHNGKEFDFPYIARRMIINGIPLPPMLDVAGRKPWEVPFLDTLEYWKFGDYKNYTSLHLLTTILKIPTPKDDIDGSMVAEVYYEYRDLKRIVTYCEKDVIAVAQIMQRFKGEPILGTDDVVHVDSDPKPE